MAAADCYCMATSCAGSLGTVCGWPQMAHEQKFILPGPCTYMAGGLAGCSICLTSVYALTPWYVCPLPACLNIPMLMQQDVLCLSGHAIGSAAPLAWRMILYWVWLRSQQPCRLLGRSGPPSRLHCRCAQGTAAGSACQPASHSQCGGPH